MWRYFSANNTNVYLAVLPKLTNDYNESKQRTIRMTPTETTDKRNEREVWQNLHTEKRPISITTPKFKLGENIRISKYKHLFE